MASIIQIKRGTGSAVPSGLADGELAINLDDGKFYFGSASVSVSDFKFDTLTVTELTSSIITSSIVRSSGSNIFGDEAADTHTFVGNITASGNISSSGTIRGKQYEIEEKSLAALESDTELTLGYGMSSGRINIGRTNATPSIFTNGHITASGNISASGTITANTITAEHITSTDDMTVTDDLLVNGNISGSSTSIIKAGSYQVDGVQFANMSGGTFQLATAAPVTQIDLGKSNAATPVFANGAITCSTDISSSGDIIATGDLDIDGKSHFTGDITASGDISSSGGIYGNTLLVNNYNTANSTGTTIRLGYDSTLTKLTYGKDSDTSHFFYGTAITASGNISASGNIYGGVYFTNNQRSLYNIGGTLNVGDGVGSVTVPQLTASGDISSSGTIFTDTLSSPGNSLSIPSDTVTITAGTAGDANLILQADTDNNDEADNAFMTFEQDGGAIRSYIGHSGADDEYPDATTFTGGISNHLIIAHSGSSGTGRGMQFGTGNTARITIDVDGNVGIGTNDPSQELEVVGDISSSAYIYAARYYANDQLALNNVNGAITLGYDNTYPINIGKATNPIKLFGHVTASGNVSSSGTIIADKVVSDNIQAGWHGSTTRIKILVSDFIPDDVGRPAMIDDTGSDRWLESHSTGKLFASIPIPTGFKATHVHIYGSGTSALEVYEADINSKTVTSKGTGNIGTELNITDVTSDTTNYLLLELAQASGEEVYGGYVTIEAV